MPSNVDIEVFRIGKTQVDRAEVQRWMAFIGASEFDVPSEEAITNPALLIALAGKRCYKSFQPGLNPNVTRIREDYTKYFDNILASGHGSVCEHSVYNFAIENVSRIFTGEMNRHRAGWAISEGSMRFIRYSQDIPHWLPTSIRGPDVLTESEKRIFELLPPEEIIEEYTGRLRAGSEVEKRHRTRLVFQRAFGSTEAWYKIMESIWEEELKPDSKFKSKKEITSMMRRIVGMGVATGGVWSGNIRALRHVIALRASAAAEEEILYVFSKVAKLMRDSEPLLFGDFEETQEGFWVPKYPKV
jgi:thymidylate synthase (FAD)